MEHFFSQNSGEDQKKKVFTKNGTLFSPNSSGHLRSGAHQSQIIGGDADVDHTQTIGGNSQIIGGIYPPSPLGFGTPVTIRLLVTPNVTKVVEKINRIYFEIFKLIHSAAK